MNPKLALCLLRLYPRDWKVRYGEEFEALLQTGRGDVRTVANIVWSALCERVFPISRLRLAMNPYPDSVVALTKLPSAFVPMVMSLTALAVLFSSIVLFGVVREADEGATAHIWQLLMIGQIPILFFFVAKWLPRTPRQALGVVALQAGAALAAMAPVFLLGL